MNLEIEQLVLDGLPPEQAPLVRAALERELRSRLDAGQVPLARERVTVDVGRGFAPAEVAVRVADALFGGGR